MAYEVLYYEVKLLKVGLAYGDEHLEVHQIVVSRLKFLQQQRYFSSLGAEFGIYARVQYGHLSPELFTELILLLPLVYGCNIHGNIEFRVYIQQIIYEHHLTSVRKVSHREDGEYLLILVAYREVTPSARHVYASELFLQGLVVLVLIDIVIVPRQERPDTEVDLIRSHTVYPAACDGLERDHNAFRQCPEVLGNLVLLLHVLDHELVLVYTHIPDLVELALERARVQFPEPYLAGEAEYRLHIAPVRPELMTVLAHLLHYRVAGLYAVQMIVQRRNISGYLTPLDLYKHVLVYTKKERGKVPLQRKQFPKVHIVYIYRIYGISYTDRPVGEYNDVVDNILISQVVGKAVCEYVSHPLNLLIL